MRQLPAMTGRSRISQNGELNDSNTPGSGSPVRLGDVPQIGRTVTGNGGVLANDRVRSKCRSGVSAQEHGATAWLRNIEGAGGGVIRGGD
jgi:hypothetical protein